MGGVEPTIGIVACSSKGSVVRILQSHAAAQDLAVVATHGPPLAGAVDSVTHARRSTTFSLRSEFPLRPDPGSWGAVQRAQGEPRGEREAREARLPQERENRRRSTDRRSPSALGWPGQRWDVGTLRITWSTCWPHPAHVVFPHVLHLTAWHMPVPPVVVARYP